MSPRYKFLRGILRIWFSIAFRKIRLLRAEVQPASGAIILVISHPPSLLSALTLVASFERQLHCVIDQKLLRGPLRRLLARNLSMIAYESGFEGQRSGLRACYDALVNQGAVVFAEPQSVRAGETYQLAEAIANISLEAESRLVGRLGVAILPVHLLIPFGRSWPNEAFIHLGAPIFPPEHLSPGGSVLPEQVSVLAATLHSACQQNPFAFRRDNIEQFLAHLAEVFRSDLEEDWASRPNWKQEIEGFELSQFVAEWADCVNRINPGRLAALHESLDAYREARRRWSLRRLKVETTDGWLQSSLRRTGVWIESVVGLPLACYGMVNHLVSWLVWAGILYSKLLKKTKLANGNSKLAPLAEFRSSKFEFRNRTGEWLARGLVVLGCYAGQIWLVAHSLGRATAGYYALTLPVSGAYLWRYGWLLRHRTHQLLLAVGVPAEETKLRRMRKELIGEFNKARDAFAATLGIAHSMTG